MIKLIVHTPKCEEDSKKAWGIPSQAIEWDTKEFWNSSEAVVYASSTKFPSFITKG